MADKGLMNFNLTNDEKRKVLKDIEYFFDIEREEKIGIIASERLLDFILESIGKTIYNKALDDAKKWFEHSLENIESDYYLLYKEKQIRYP